MVSRQAVSYPPATGRFIVSCVVAFIAGLLTLISFASPYWLESFEETREPFVRMGLWEFCFNNFRYPRYQLDRKFHGCHYIFSEEYLVIREWLQPGWLMLVEAMMCVALIFSLTSLCLLGTNLMRYFLKYEVYFLGPAWVLQILTAVPIFLSVAVFGAKCQDRTWFLNPLYNHPSWAYAFAVVAAFLHTLAAIYLYLETRQAWERKNRGHQLVSSESTPYRY